MGPREALFVKLLWPFVFTAVKLLLLTTRRTINSHDLHKTNQSASQTCDFDAKNAKFYGKEAQPPPQTPSGEDDTPSSPHLTPLGAFGGASILTPPILKFCLRYTDRSNRRRPNMVGTCRGWFPRSGQWL